MTAVEFDERTINNYNLIHNSNFEASDITKINEKELPDCDIVCYSPPCQAFSLAGKQLGFEDKRGVLFFDALRIIKEKKPKYALMENVKGLTQKKFNAEFKEMLLELEEAGYKNYWRVLNAKDYGIPQNRERVFVISVREDILKDFSFPEKFDSPLRLKHLLENDVDEKYYISEERFKKLLETVKEQIKPAPSGITQVTQPKFSQQRVYSSEGIAPTIAAGNLGGGKEPCKIIQIGLLDMKGNEQVRRVYDPEGLSPTLNTMQGGNRQPKIIVNDTYFDIDNDNLVLSTATEPKRNYKLRIRKLTPKECLR